MVAGALALSRALNGLLDGVRTDTDKLAACRSKIDSDLEKRFAKVDSLIAGGRRAEARNLLIEMDEHYGGLAAPRSVDLAAQPLE